MEKNKLLEQKKLMGIIEQSDYTVQQVPISVNKKINDMQNYADAAFHSSEIAARSFKKILERLGTMEKKAAESADVLEAEAKTMSNLIRVGMEQIDTAQSRANDLLRALDYVIGGTYKNGGSI